MHCQQQTENVTQDKEAPKDFLVADCAFLRVVRSPEGSERYTCLMQKGADCTQKSDYPYGSPCHKAVKKVYVDRAHRNRYWKSLKKHTMVPALAKKGYFQGKSSKKEEYMFCKRKNRYPDEKTAEMNRKHCEKVRGVPLRVLYCPFCKGWHLTHKHAKPRDNSSSSSSA